MDCPTTRQSVGNFPHCKVNIPWFSSTALGVLPKDGRQAEITIPELRMAWQQGRKDLFIHMAKRTLKTLGEED
jgi:hypothetical protein